MILYFTGTGNSKFAADVISEHTGDICVSLNNVLKNNTPATFQSELPFVIVAPIYAWRFPIIIEELIKKAEFIGSTQLYFIATMASESGNCNNYCKKLCEMKGMEFKGFYGVPMPSNYVILDIMPKEAEVHEILNNAVPVLKDVADKILHEANIKKTDNTSLSWIKSGIVNSLFNRFMVNSKNFIVSDKCILCGKCKDFCSVNNIEIINGKPSFGDKCINCCSCIQRCPTSAINVKGKTETHGRYVCPEYRKEDFN
ncbi:MAG: EFR1 family ferrodoxin [Clostridium sp.]